MQQVIESEIKYKTQESENTPKTEINFQIQCLKSQQEYIYSFLLICIFYLENKIFANNWCLRHLLGSNQVKEEI